MKDIADLVGSLISNYRQLKSSGTRYSTVMTSLIAAEAEGQLTCDTPIDSSCFKNTYSIKTVKALCHTLNIPEKFVNGLHERLRYNHLRAKTLGGLLREAIVQVLGFGRAYAHLSGALQTHFRSLCGREDSPFTVASLVQLQQQNTAQAFATAVDALTVSGFFSKGHAQQQASLLKRLLQLALSNQEKLVQFIQAFRLLQPYAFNDERAFESLSDLFSLVENNPRTDISKTVQRQIFEKSFAPLSTTPLLYNLMQPVEAPPVVENPAITKKSAVQHVAYKM